MGPRGAPNLGSVSPALLHGEKERLNRNCSTDSRSWLYSQMPYDILPQNATTESREVRVSDTSHLTRPVEIQNSLALVKSAADRAVPCRKGEIFEPSNDWGGLGCNKFVPVLGRDGTKIAGLCVVMRWDDITITNEMVMGWDGMGRGISFPSQATIPSPSL